MEVYTLKIFGAENFWFAANRGVVPGREEQVEPRVC